MESSYGVDWLKKGIWYGSAKMDNRLSMYNISDEVIKFIQNMTKNWRVELTAKGKSFVEPKIKRVIFLGDTLSPLLFAIAMMPLTYILRKCTSRYKLHRSQKKQQLPNVPGRHKTVCTFYAWERIGREDIQWR